MQYEAADGAGGIDRAVTLAKAVDVPIVFATYPQNEGTDNASIDLPGQQNQLISSVAAANPKTIVVLHTGSAVTLPWLNQVSGVLEGWYGLSYTTFGFSDLHVGGLGPDGATVTATVTDTGGRAGAEVAQPYVGDPASTGEPVHQLKGFQRVDLGPGESTTVSFTVTAHDLAHWDSGWTTTPGTYQILVGDSSRNLPLTGSLAVPSALRSNVSGAPSRAGSVVLANPHGMSAPAGVTVSLPVRALSTAGGSLTFTAAGLPAGLSISRTGVISGAVGHTGTATITVTATDATGAAGTATFVWTTTPAGHTAHHDRRQ